MKLSEAIRKGSKNVKQNRFGFFKFKEGQVCCACALGAAAMACGYQPDPARDWDDDTARNQVVKTLVAATGIDVRRAYSINGYRETLLHFVVFKNDTEGQIFSEIADWLEGQGL